MKTLKLAKVIKLFLNHKLQEIYFFLFLKRKIIGRKVSETPKDTPTDTENENVDANENTNIDQTQSPVDTNESIEQEEVEENEVNLEEGEEAPKKSRLRKSIHGTSFIEIPGTPIVNDLSGVSILPTCDKFSENICEHKPFDMGDQTPKGSYQNIVKLTRDFKSAVAQPKFE